VTLHPSRARLLHADLLLDGWRASGRCQLPDAYGRLVDLLAARGEEITLLDVTLFGLSGRLIERVPEMQFATESIYAAAPVETEEDFARRRLERTGAMRPVQTLVPVSVLFPPFRAQGNLHLNALGSMDIRALPGFFPLTEATLTLGNESLYSGPILLVNRERVAGLGRRRTGGPLPSTEAQTTPSDLSLATSSEP
jgi:hypothetical protein